MRAPRLAFAFLLPILGVEALYAGVNRWTSSGPATDVTSLAMDSAGNLYATSAHGVYRSLNQGASWEIVNATMAGPAAVWRIASDPVRPSVLYATGREAVRSTDGGFTWTVITPSVAPLTFFGNALSTDPIRTDTVYVGGSFPGLFRTSDGGASWRRLGEETIHGVTTVAIDPRNTLRIFVGANNGRVFRSLDGGESWTLVHYLGDWVSQVAIDRQTSVIYVVGNRRAAKSDDGGNAWYAIHGSLGEAIAVDPGNPSIVYGARGGEPSPGGIGPPPSDGVYRSADGGRTVTAFQVGLPHPVEPAALLIDLSGRFLHLASSLGVFSHEIREVAEPPLRLIPSDQSVPVGQLPSWTATLDAVQGTDTVISLGSSHPVVLFPPASVLIPAGVLSVPFSGSRFGTGLQGGRVVISAVVPENLGGGIATAVATFRPYIQSLIPNHAAAGGPDFVLGVVGYTPDAEFTSASVIYWNGTPRPTSLDCPFGLVAILSCISTTIPAAEISTPGTVQVGVRNSDAFTNLLPFTIGGGAAVDVPTLGEWGRLAFMALLAAVALIVLARVAGR